MLQHLPQMAFNQQQPHPGFAPPRLPVLPLNQQHQSHAQRSKLPDPRLPLTPTIGSNLCFETPVTPAAQYALTPSPFSAPVLPPFSNTNLGPNEFLRVSPTPDLTVVSQPLPPGFPPMGFPRRFPPPPSSQRRPQFNRPSALETTGLFPVPPPRGMRGVQTSNQQRLLLFKNQAVNIFGSGGGNGGAGHVPFVSQPVPTSSMFPTVPSSVQGALQPMPTSAAMSERGRQMEEYR